MPEVETLFVRRRPADSRKMRRQGITRGQISRPVAPFAAQGRPVDEL